MSEPTPARLTEIVARMHQLLQAPEPGLFSWNQMLVDYLKELHPYCQQGAPEKDWAIQRLNRTIEEQKDLVEVLRRIERLLGCKHVDNGREDANNIVCHVRDLQEEVARLKELDDLNGRYIAERDKQLDELRTLVLKLSRLLKRVPHHGPQGSSSTELCPPGCWPDCVACEYEKLTSMSR